MITAFNQTFIARQISFLSNFLQEEVIREEIDDGRTAHQVTYKQIRHPYSIR